jgi:hypothetical protein
VGYLREGHCIVILRHFIRDTIPGNRRERGARSYESFSLRPFVYVRRISFMQMSRVRKREYYWPVHMVCHFFHNFFCESFRLGRCAYQDMRPHSLYDLDQRSGVNALPLVVRLSVGDLRGIERISMRLQEETLLVDQPYLFIRLLNRFGAIGDNCISKLVGDS